MADETTTPKQRKSTTTAAAVGNTAVPQHGDHDRVAMLSLRADGTPDQLNPEIIGDREFAEAATREQFQQQAVSAVDTAERAATTDAAAAAEQVEQDPSIAELKGKHDAAADAAVAAADATVDALYQDDDKSKA